MCQHNVSADFQFPLHESGLRLKLPLNLKQMNDKSRLLDLKVFLKSGTGFLHLWRASMEVGSLDIFIGQLAATLESGIDVGQGINVGPGKFVKKNKHRAWKTHQT